MKCKYSHYLLTRFNVGLYTHNRVNDPEKWMTERLNLFESFCLPSIMSQTCQHFKWLVMIDKRTPTKDIQKLQTYRTLCRNMIPFINTESSIDEGFQSAIRNCRWITDLQITTRFDNDDALSTNAIEIIQSHIPLRKNKNIFINLMGGYVYDYVHKEMYSSYQPSNAFISVIQKSKENKNIFFYGSHPRIKNDHEVIDVKGEHWIQIIHKDNLMNKIQGRKIDKSNIDMNRFKILQDK